jgi:Spy/CpxP family protein refolding chaperone
MRRETGFRLWEAGLLAVMAFLVLGPGQAWGEPGPSYSSLEREALGKELALTGEQTKAFQAIGDKLDKTREGIVAELRKKETDLEKAMAAPKPNEQKIKELVAAITQSHEQLFQSLKAQRQEEMALLTPMQQGKFVLALKKWHEEMKEKLER